MNVFFKTLVMVSLMSTSTLTFADIEEDSVDEPTQAPTSAAVTPPDATTTAIATVDPNCPSIDSVHEEGDQDVSDCRQALNTTEDACAGNGGGDGGGGGSSELVQMMMTMSLANLMQNTSKDQQQSMGSICQAFSGLTGMGGSFNSNINTACKQTRQTCVNGCLQASQKWEDRANALNTTCTTKAAVQQVASEIRSVKVRCDGIRPSQAVASQASNQGGASNSAMQGICTQLMQQLQQPQDAQTASLTPLAPPGNTVDCSNPMMAQTATCKSCASDPGNPACLKQPTDGGTGASINEGTSQNASAAGFNVPGAGDGQIAQNAQFAASNPTQQRANAPEGGSSPFGGQPIPPGAPDSGGRGGAGGGGGYNAKGYDITERARSGYTSNVEAAAAPGYFAGYERAAASKDEPQLDLKQYLPGHPLNENYRRVAGVGSANPDINPSSIDIFQRISDRFRLICASSRLHDCNMVPLRSH